MTTIKQESLENGLQINFTDESNRYFGDYHRVCVVATIVCNLRDLPADSTDEEAFRCRAVEAHGEQLSVVKRFERMGVSSADVEYVRNADSAAPRNGHLRQQCQSRGSAVLDDR